MSRNGLALPLLCLALAPALWLLAYADGAARTHHGRPVFAVPSTLQIGLLAFAALALLEGLIGLLSVWLEGREPAPHRGHARAGLAATIIALSLAVVLTAVSGLFVRVVAVSVLVGHFAPMVEGLSSSAMFVLAAALLVTVRKGFVADEVVTEDTPSTEAP